MGEDSPPDPDPARGARRFHHVFLLCLVAGISLLFVLVIRPFLLAVLLAAVFAGLAHPPYRWVLRWLRGRRALAALLVILVLLLGVALPFAGFLTMVASEAVQVSQGAQEWFRDQAGRMDELRSLVSRIPFADRIIPDGERLADQFRELAGRSGPALMGNLAAATRGTLNFFLQLFVLLYAMFFFLKDGPDILQKILSYIPLGTSEKEEMLERFVSVTRATIKGSLLIGAIQGAAAGVAFWVLGVPGAAFWGTVMAVLSVIPAVGAALVWIPAVVYLLLIERVAAGMALFAWCAVVVSTLDNFLRPRLIGRDARMSDLLTLLSTLGGIFLFGAVGFIVGPIVAALFVTIWHIYGRTFRKWLPAAPEAGA
ncbi:MAG TPA: AI-2E family transporter [Thermoanaerobaculia bacterium]|nr:AI-2E family transporter [Thermoanaerobaculia bacterium]